MSKRTTELVKKDNLLSENKDIDVKEDHFKELMSIYEAAMDKMTMYLNEIKRDVKKFYDYDVIDHISSRLKSPESIKEKLIRRGYPISLESIENNLFDIAGVRVICSFIDDIYMLADCLLAQDDITLIEKKDYIKNPKPNGYRSLHLIIEVPIYLQNTKKKVKVEVQLRTIAMEFWAKLEHRLRYKKHLDEKTISYTSDELLECANLCSTLDTKMQNIRNIIEK